MRVLRWRKEAGQGSVSGGFSPSAGPLGAAWNPFSSPCPPELSRGCQHPHEQPDSEQPPIVPQLDHCYGWPSCCRGLQWGVPKAGSRQEP